MALSFSFQVSSAHKNKYTFKCAKCRLYNIYFFRASQTPIRIAQELAICGVGVGEYKVFGTMEFNNRKTLNRLRYVRVHPHFFN